MYINGFINKTHTSSNKLLMNTKYNINFSKILINFSKILTILIAPNIISGNLFSVPSTNQNNKKKEKKKTYKK